MGLRPYPKSIRGKLLLAFLAAIVPVIVVSIGHEIRRSTDAGAQRLREYERAADEVANHVSAVVASATERQQVLAYAVSQLREPSGAVSEAAGYLNSLAPGGARLAVRLDNSESVAIPARGVGESAVSGLKRVSSGRPGFVISTPFRFARGGSAVLTAEYDAQCLSTAVRDGLRFDQVCTCAVTSGSGSVAVPGVGGRTPVFLAEDLSARAEHVGSSVVRLGRCPRCGRPSVGAGERIAGTPWRVTVLDADDPPLFSAISSHSLLIQLTGASLFGLLLVFVMGNRLARPVRRLARAATAIAVGDYGRRMAVESDDELGMLAESFNKLGDSLVSREQVFRQQTNMLTGMVEAARVASSSLDIKQCGKAVAKAVCVYLGATAAVVYRKDTVNGGVSSIGQSGKASKVAWKRLASHTTDSADYLLMGEQSDAGGGECCLVGVPLLSGRESVGAIVARFGSEVTRESLKLGTLRADVLTAFGVHAAAAISNAEVFSQAERYSEVLEDWVEHLSSVMQVADAISPSLDLDEVLEALAKATAEVMCADCCVILLPGADGLLEVKGCSVDNAAVRAMRIPSGEGVSGKAFAQKRYAACTDLSRSANALGRKLAAVTGTKGILSTPLMVADEPTGVITVTSAQPRRFSPKEIRLLTSIGLHTAVIVRNAALYSREASIARALQNDLVSEAPAECRGLEFAARYIAALDEARVGGDFYDVTPLPNGKVVVVIGDVSGKGLKAAVHLAATKYMLKGLMYAHQDDPSVVLGKLNETLNYYFGLSFFVTLFYAVIDPRTCTIDYANAGHPPALLVTQDRKMHTCLPTTGTPAGSGLSCRYRTQRIQAEPRDLLLLYTDGVTETMKDGGMVGVEGLHSLVFDAGQRSHSQLIDYVCDQLSGGRAQAFKDDFAIMAVSFEHAVAAGDSNTGGSRERKYHLQTSIARR